MVQGFKILFRVMKRGIVSSLIAVTMSIVISSLFYFYFFVPRSSRDCEPFISSDQMFDERNGCFSWGLCTKGLYVTGLLLPSNNAICFSGQLVVTWRFQGRGNCFKFTAEPP